VWAEEDVLLLNAQPRTIVDVEPIDGVLVFSVDEPGVDDEEDADDEEDLPAAVSPVWHYTGHGEGG